MEGDIATLADNFGPDLDQLPRSVINGQCSTSSGSTDFSFWLQADIQSPEIEVCLSPNSRHSRADVGLRAYLV